MTLLMILQVLCLNIGVDPPDVVKISPCARLECWVDPLSMQPAKALETIGKGFVHTATAQAQQCGCFSVGYASGQVARSLLVSMCCSCLPRCPQARTSRRSTSGGSLVPSIRCTWTPPWMMSRSWQHPAGGQPSRRGCCSTTTDTGCLDPLSMERFGSSTAGGRRVHRLGVRCAAFTCCAAVRLNL